MVTNGQVASIALSERARACSCTTGATPVSYTHLDVYKRQAKDALFATGRADATLADGLIETARRSLTGIPDGSRASIWRTYAHLDTRGGFIATRGRLPTHMIDRITCDGILRQVWELYLLPH